MTINYKSFRNVKMEIVQQFAGAMKKKFEKYFLAHGIQKTKTKTVVNLVIDDRDVKRMTKQDLLRKLDVMTNAKLFELLAKAKSKEHIEAKVHLLSDLNQANVWQALGDSATVMDVKSMAGFIQLNLPEKFFDAYDRLPEKFKLNDLKKEFEQLSGKRYHRNTYQNWLKGLQKAAFAKLKGKIYQKIFRGMELK